MTVRQWKNKLIKEVETDTFYNEKIGISYEIYTDYPLVLELSARDEGKRIWLAGEYRTLKAKLERKKNGYLEVRVDGQFRTLYSEEAILHPDELTEERLEKYGYEVKDGRKNA